jgi:ODP family beta lactamase
METQVTEIAPDIYRLSTYSSDADFIWNQFLIDADEPLLFHTGLRSLFPPVSAAVARLIPIERLRWVTFGHVEADECGSMNSWLAAAPHAQVAHGTMGCLVQVNDLADRPPRPQRRRGHRPRRQASTPDRNSARATRLGRRPVLRGDHRDPSLRRSVHHLR